MRGIVWWISLDGNHGLKDSSEPRGEETKACGSVETKHFLTTTTDWSSVWTDDRGLGR